MELYTATSRELAKLLTRRYSTSFSSSSRLFAKNIRPHIYAIYGLVRVADEIVDTYQGDDMCSLLDNLEHEVLQLLDHDQPFSPNPIVQAFAVTAQQYSISDDLITPFFASMRSDITATTFTQAEYDAYIYGSAEVIGLMCLKVFVGGDAAQYEQLAPGASALGRAYQKVNFLRDIASDHEQRGRWYFPISSFDAFDTDAKQSIEADIVKDFAAAVPAIQNLPVGARRAVRLSYRYYSALFGVLQQASPATIKTQRIRVAGWQKLCLLVTARVGQS